TDELNKNISSDYQDIQIRTLTKWINVQLSQVDEHIDSIDKDLKNGKKLLKLLSVVSKNTSALKPERGNMRIHELSNVALALKFLQDEWGADSLPAIGSEAIVNGD
ncbi:calponin homology domain-containing protein, partial [Mucor mucedo]